MSFFPSRHILSSTVPVLCILSYGVVVKSSNTDCNCQPLIDPANSFKAQRPTAMDAMVVRHKIPPQYTRTI